MQPTNPNISLQVGDLLLKRTIDDDFAQAIVASASAPKGAGFNHVGVAFFEAGQWYVLEAIAEGVCKTPLKNYATANAVLVLGRLKVQYQHIIPQALARIKQHIGKPYDMYYSRSDAAFYCSELVQKFYLDDGKPLFPPINMSFKSRTTGEFLPYWLVHFNTLNHPIPEGELGSNPSMLSTSDKITIVGVFDFNTAHQPKNI